MFTTGFQCGVLPDDILDMSLETFKAIIAGYSQRLADQQELAVQSGFWAGYYSGMGRKKPVSKILEKIERARYKIAGKRAPDVDVDSFLKTEREFKARLGGTKDE